MRVEIWHNPACGTSRNALALIRHAGIEPVIVEYLVETPDKQTLARAIAGRPRLLLVDGIFDRLDTRSRELAANAIFSSAAPWTLVVATRRDDIRERCARCLVLEGDAG